MKKRNYPREEKITTIIGSIVIICLFFGFVGWAIVYGNDPSIIKYVNGYASLLPIEEYKPIERNGRKFLPVTVIFKDDTLEQSKIKDIFIEEGDYAQTLAESIFNKDTLSLGSCRLRYHTDGTISIIYYDRNPPRP